jgi:hypothetical protein
MRWVIAIALMAGCWRASPPPPPPAPLIQAPSPPRPVRAKPGAPGELYALDEALDDALSGPWSFVGTGEWFGMFRVNACVYRNARVFIVNIYCTLKEKAAFGLVVLSPTRGRAYIYAEGERPISGTTRKDWMTFKGEAHLPADEKSGPLRLDFTYAELRAWDEKRYYGHAPACFGGVEINRPQKGCLKLDSHVESWAERNKAFLEEPTPEWYRIIREMRDRVKTDARPYTGP